MAEHLEAGRRAEAFGRRYLERQGLHLLASNYRCRLGELDLVMRDDQIVIVVEIRYRQRPQPVAPAVTVDWRKQRRIVRTTRHFLMRHPRLTALPLRFDILALVGDLDRPKIQWMRGAFRLDGGLR